MPAVRAAPANLLTVGQSNAQVIGGGLNFFQGSTAATSDIPYLHWTPTYSGDRSTWTVSCWAKPSIDSSGYLPFFMATDDNFSWAYEGLFWFSNNLYYIDYISSAGGGTYNVLWRTTASYRDTGWYHIMAVKVDNSTFKLYVNGEEVTDLQSSTNNGAQSTWWNVSGQKMYLGAYINTSSGAGYSCRNIMSQFHFIDGLALGPGYFGYNDPLTNTWRPKEFKADRTTVNNGTDWSAGLTGTADGSGPITKMFDGDTTDGSWADSSGYVVAFPGGVRATNNIKIYGGSVSANWYVVIGGKKTVINAPGGSSPAWSGSAVSNYVNLGPGVLTSIGTEGVGIAQNGEVSGIEIDGVIMKDSTTQNLDYGTNGFYLPMDGNTPIGQDQSGKGNDWTRKNFFGDLPSEATGPQPIYKTIHGGAVATAGVSTDTAGNYCTFAVPLHGNHRDVSHWVNNATSEINCQPYTLGGSGIPAAPGAANVLYGGSYFFKGDEASTNGGSLGYGDSADFEFGSGDYTVEGWACPTGDLGNSDENCIMSKWQSNGSKRAWMMYISTSSSNDRFRWSWSNGGGDTNHLYSNNSIVRRWKWYHWAVCKDSTNVRMYINGIQQDSVNASPGSVNDGGDAKMTIGAYYDGGTVGKSGLYRGYLSDIRIYKGVAKYTNLVNFTPSSWSGNLVKDTASGVVYGSELVKPTTGGIISDGNGDNLYLAETSDFAFGTGDFTIEGWFYGSERNNDTYPYLFDFREDASSNSVSPALYWNNDETLYYWQNNTAKISWGTGKYIPWKWSHYAVVRISGTTTLYFDGKSVGSYSDSGNYPDARLTIGQRRDTSGQSWPGMYSNFRVVKGTGVYTANFVPPTTPLTNITNTKLLCCQSSTSVTESAVTPGTITANGDLKATTFNPFDTNVSVARGMESNYCTWNQDLKRAGAFIFDANCAFWHYETYGWKSCAGTISVGGSGKWYFEVIPNLDCPTSDTAMVSIGVADERVDLTDDISQNALTFMYENDGNKYNQADGSATYGDTFTSGDIIGVSMDFDNGGVLRFYKNGIDQGAAVSNLNQVGSGRYYPCIGSKTSQYPNEGNWGQKPWHYPPPDGFKAICISNIPGPGLVRPDQYVKPLTYTGTGASLNVGGLGFKPDLVWIKQRNEQRSWGIFDTVRGVNKAIRCDGDVVQYTTGGGLGAFRDDGFEVGDNTVVGKSGGTYVAWCWKAGGNKNTFNVDDVGFASFAASGTTAGSITPTGTSIGTKQGFSIIQYEGTGSAGTIPHGLSEAPKFVIIKDLDTNYSWVVGHEEIGWSNVLKLEGTDAALDRTYFNDTAPTNTVVSVSGENSTNKSGDTYIMYSWASIEGVQKFGKYTGSGNDETFASYVYLGFRPAVVWVKCTSDSGQEWVGWDDKRSPYNVVETSLYMNSDASEASVGTTRKVDFCSYGFKLRNGSSGATDYDARTYIYMAWADQPAHNLYGGQSNAR